VTTVPGAKYGRFGVWPVLPRFIFKALVAIGIAVAALGSTRNAVAATGEPAQVAPQQPQPPPPPPESPLSSPILKKIAAAPPRGDFSREDWSALASFYTERHGTPLWVSGSGFSERGQEAIAEIRRADDWGLDARAFDLPPTNPRKTPEALAEAEIKIAVAVLKYARQAHGGRVNPSLFAAYFDQAPNVRDPKRVLREIAAAGRADAYLRSLHPKHPQFELLRKALLRARGGHVDIGAKAPAGGALKSSRSAARRDGYRPWADPDDDNAGQGEDDPGSDSDDSASEEPPLPWAHSSGASVPDNIRKILVNMERWRWMPDDLGQFYVWDNVPEFETRVVKNGNVIHSDKIIVGKPSTPTPVFSARMQTIVFHPEWAVPDSIKVNDLLPHLRYEPGFFGAGEGTDTSILRQHNLRVVYNGQPVDPAQVDWSRVDIRQYQFLQAPSDENVLGTLKFRFPNKHDVYMHDTPERNLFVRSNRALSHGCMRVQNPRRLAEVLLGEDKGWQSGQIANLLATGYNTEVELSHPIPVHVTYFTAVANADGTMQYYSDIYGLDGATASALQGRAVRLNVPRESDAESLAEQEPEKPRHSGGIDDLFSILLGF
jgi:murein L,D-transpeptidase YcbB/YkuD